MGGTSAAEETQRGYSVPCPFRDGSSGDGELIGKALEALVNHIRDAHTSNIPEPAKGEVRTKLTACANTLGTLPL